MKKNILLATALCTLLVGCGGGSSSGSTKGDGTSSSEPTQVDTSKNTDLASIQKTIPSNLDIKFKDTFVKYTKITAPNGKPIHIVAQNKITDEKMIRVKNILEFYLTNYEGSEYGANKDEVRNSMANNNAVLLLLNGTDDGANPASEAGGQPLYENEIQIEGGPWYKAQNYEHRDASYEEILHFVHDNGIGVDGKGGGQGPLRDTYQKEIRKAQEEALKNKAWTADSDTLKEWANENSLTQEYLASVVDAYYGLWGAWNDPSNKSMWGLYTPKSRADMKEKDPKGLALMENKFFHPYFTYNARIDKSFTGTFSLKFDTSIPYTHHSRYLKDITLLGNNPINVKGNELDNFITGNSGVNTVIFSGDSTQYIIKTTNGTTTVEDKIPNRDGKDSLKNIEKLQFSDKTITLSDEPTQALKNGIIVSNGVSDATLGITKDELSKFIIKGDKATMSGTINADTIRQVKKLISDYPAVKTIVMQNVDGSIDDESNLIASRLVRNAKLNTIVPKNGSIASGGTDFFIAGVTRKVEDGGKVGVHSWADSEVSDASKLSKDDQRHQPYIKYYKEMGLAKASDFYFFTINQAKADSMHEMTQEELRFYGLVNEK